jgi:PAS domain S-box-containing protein
MRGSPTSERRQQERDAVDALAHEIERLTARLRPLLVDAGPDAWPGQRGRTAVSLSRDLGTAVQALDAAVEALYLQADSLEGVYLALEVERRANQELFESGPDGYLVSDPDGLIVRANARAGELFGCPADDLVGHSLPAMMGPDDGESLAAAIRGLELADWNAEWLGEAVRAGGVTFRVALTAAVVRHSDRAIYRVQWSVRDVGRRPNPD